MTVAAIPRAVEPFASAADHLLAELERLDLILLERVEAARAQRADQGWRTDEPSPPSLLVGGSGTDRADVAAIARQIRARVEATLEAGTRMPLLEVTRNLELDAVSVGMLILATAIHLDRKYERVFAYLQDDAKRRVPRVELLLEVFGSTAVERLTLRDRLSSNSPLLRSGFVTLAPPPEGPHESWLSQPVVVDPRLVRFLLDQPGADPMAEAMRHMGPSPPTTVGLQRALDGFCGAWELDPLVVGVIRTDDPIASLGGAHAAAAKHDRCLLAIDVSRPSALAHPVGPRIRRAFEEARLTHSLLLVLGFEALGEPERLATQHAIADSLRDFEVPVLVVTSGRGDLHDLGEARTVMTLTATDPDIDERMDLWRSAGEDADHDHLCEIARRFRMGSTQIRRASALSRLLAAAQSPPHPGDAPPLTRACQIESRHKLGDLAQRVEPCFAWDDLILPDNSVGQLRTAVDHVRHHETVFHRWGLGKKSPYGQGLVVLFSGPPGTGKTMSASLMAGDAGWELFRINLSTIVSKYIGETEKNLERVFNAAWRSNAVLFFDEADALFGKRTEVKDAHDRHANIETSYLLQRLETYDGVVILATNLKKNIDDAFLRRIQIIVDFPFPTPDMRGRLWRSLIPPAMPVADDLDFEFLANGFELAGGAIKNAIQTGAIIAAADGGALSMRALLVGTQRELLKQGKILTPSDFGVYASLLDARRGPGDQTGTRVH